MLAYSAADNTDHVIAFISSPSAFVSFQQKYPSVPAILLEFDTRFARAFPQHFYPFDYRDPVSSSLLPMKANVFVVDPPFLSEECLTRTMHHVEKISAEHPKIILCTGAIMQNLAKDQYHLKCVHWRPKHQADRLSNEFRCFTNFESAHFIWEG